MTDASDIAIKLEEQSKLLKLGDVCVLNKHAIVVQFFLQDFCTEPFRNECDFQITAVTVVCSGTEIYDTVRIERRTVALGIQADADCAGDSFRLCVGKGAVLATSELGGMNIFQVIFDFITHVD